MLEKEKGTERTNHPVLLVFLLIYEPYRRMGDDPGASEGGS
jgi:hypothetical protein